MYLFFKYIFIFISSVIKQPCDIINLKIIKELILKKLICVSVIKLDSALLLCVLLLYDEHF